MTKTIAVVGATGNVGGRVAAKLAAKGFKVRGITRHGATQGGAPVKADLTKPAEARRALEGCQAMYLTLALDTDDPLGHQRAVVENALDAAQRAGVRHIVAHTLVQADRGNTGSKVIDEKHAVEGLIEEAGVPFTVLRPGWFLQMLHPLKPAFEQGALPLPLPPGVPFAVVSAEDVATAACAFFELGPQDRGFDVHVSATGEDLARAIGEARGAPVRFVPMAGQARQWAEPIPVSPAFKELIAGMFDYAAQGAMQGKPGEVQRILPGFRYTTVDEFARTELYPRAR
ncbi:MAG TPA: NmrA family NAD(P)-binding protein [Candidatus Thermoplasmatota archaeon]|jgi:uncharacterized protein YbjT (DUF2867 family)|nr:NmrA family NAD(P)-binding protein [Candidatus Thermoplasmatota archaeon]